MKLSSLKNAGLGLFKSLRTTDSFVQNSAFMFSASGLAIFIQFLFFPILSRIYSPEAYGVFGVFNFYATMVGSVATLSLTQAFVLPRTSKEFVSLLKLTIIIAIAVCLFVSLLCMVAGPALMHLLKTEELGIWVYFIGLGALLIAFDRILLDWAVSQRIFNKQTFFTSTNTLFNKLFNLGYGKFISASAGGLVITNILLYGVQVILFLFFVVKDSFGILRTKISKKEMRKSASDYRAFPRYIFIGNLVNLVSNNLPAVVLPATGFALSTVGFYNYSLLVLDLPIRLMGSGISSVFLPKALEINESRPEELSAHTWKLFRIMTLLSMLSVGVVFTFGEPMYKLFFGNNWGEAGRAAEILAIYYYFRLISAPLAVLFNVLRKEKGYYNFQLILFAVRLLSLFVGVIVTDNFVTLMTIFSIANAICYFVLTINILRMANIELAKGVRHTLTYGCVVFGAGFVIKYFLF